MEELQLVELVIREDEGVIEQCVISGIPREDMHKVYCDRQLIFLAFSCGPCSQVSGAIKPFAMKSFLRV